MSCLLISHRLRLQVQALWFDHLPLSRYAAGHLLENPAGYGHFDSGYSVI
jgi:hypothetical protein